MLRIAVIVLIIIIVSAFIGKHLLKLRKINDCHECDGQGFYRGTRGEKNTCRSCGGSGKRR